MKNIITALIFLCVQSSFSKDVPLESPELDGPSDVQSGSPSNEKHSDKYVEIGVKAESVFPIFLGPSLTLTLGKHFETALGFGLTPEAYYNVIADVSASMGGNSAYADVIRAAFKNNSMVKISGLYKWAPQAPGWFFGAGANQLKSKGDADIDTVLTAATGRDYSELKSLLTILGRSTKVDLTSDLLIVELFGGYIWPLTSTSEFKLGFGVAKIVDAKVKLATGLSSFESSAAGKNLLSQSESDLVQIIKDNGISPTILVNFDYFF
jgi:hypothetical protein